MSHPLQPGIGLRIRCGDVIEKPTTFLSQLRRHLGQPDSRLDRLDLAEERPYIVELEEAPMLKESGGLRRDVPLIRIRQRTPAIDLNAKLINKGGGQLVLLLVGGEALPLVEYEVFLTLLLLFRLRDRGDELGLPAPFDQPVRRLARLVELPMFLRVLVGRVLDRLLEEGVSHRSCLMLCVRR